MRRSLVASMAALLLAGCASKLGGDLHAAEAPCRDQHFNEKAALVACLDAQDRPIWSRDEPATLDVYDGFAKQRSDLAQQYDSGALTQDQYSAKLDQLETGTRAQLAERRKQAAPAQ